MNDGRYRSVFHSPIQPAEARLAARDEMRTWLRSKGYDLARFDEGDSRVGPGAVLLRNSANSADGSQTWRWQLRETTGEGAWLSSLVVQAPAKPAGNAVTWFWIEVEFQSEDAAAEQEKGVRAGVPRLARGLLSRVESRDALALLTNEPTLVGRDSVDDLIDVLCDPERRLPVVVASAHPGLDFEEWRRLAARVTRHLPGLASIYLLDPLGTTAFLAGIGRSHAVWGGALRTYLPDVDPAVAGEALRHRVLSAAKVLADPGRAAGILSVVPRRLASEAPLPGPLAGVNRALLTQTHDLPAVPDVAHMRARFQVLIEERELALRLAEDEEARANTFFVQRESALAELVEREQRVLDLENLVRSLRKRLVASGRADVAYLPADEAATPPTTFAELLDWMESELTLIKFTGNRHNLVVLDQRPESSTWVRSSWEVLRALQAYADAKQAQEFAGDFKMWCENPPSETYAIPAGKIVRDESETVKNNSRWRRQREFPVPAEINTSRRVFMGAHIRIGASASGRINPRLHYYDATAQSGRIYIGYIGRHLTNTRT
jgi:hypothetical protein